MRSRLRAALLGFLAAVCLPSPGLSQTAPSSGAPASPPAGAPAPPAQQVPPVPATRLPVDVTGASQIEYDAQTQHYRFTGEHVVVVRGDQRLVAAEILYDGDRRLAVLPRGGTISTPTLDLKADVITADLGRRHFIADGTVTGRMLDEGLWTRIDCAHLVADDRPDLRRAEATGDVIAVRSDQELRGDRVVYDRIMQRGLVEGHAVLARGDDRLSADRITVDLATNDAEATGHIALERKAQDTHASGDAVTYSRRTGTAVLTGHATVVRRRDTITADRITMRLDADEAVADGHAVLTGYPAEQPPGSPQGAPPRP